MEQIDFDQVPNLIKKVYRQAVIRYRNEIYHGEVASRASTEEHNVHETIDSAINAAKTEIHQCIDSTIISFEGFVGPFPQFLADELKESLVEMILKAVGHTFDYQKDETCVTMKNGELTESTVSITLPSIGPLPWDDAVMDNDLTVMKMQMKMYMNSCHFNNKGLPASEASSETEEEKT